jgi:AcrR family transcriptional regulator
MIVRPRATHGRYLSETEVAGAAANGCAEVNPMSEPASRGRGKRPGTDTKAIILQTALELFASTGYDRTTVRSIARQSDVDPALIYHYFGTKHGLLEACISVPDEAASVVSSIERTTTTAGDFLTDALSMWNEPSMRKRLTALLRVSMASPEAQRLYTDLVQVQLIDPLAARIGGPDAELRATLAASHAIGIALARFVFEFEPLASADDAALARLAAPALDAYLSPSASPLRRR